MLLNKVDDTGSKALRFVPVLIGLCVIVIVSFSSVTQISNMKQLTSLQEGSFYSSMSEEEQEQLFEEFIDKYGRDYGDDSTSALYIEKFTVFKQNLELCDERNAMEMSAMGDAIHGITKFSDMTSEEYESAYLMTEYWSDDSERRFRRLKTKKSAQKASKSTESGTTLTETVVDWTDIYTTPVYDQGTGCRGASWAFAAVEQIESDAIRKGVIATDGLLSVQQLLSCNTNSSGCLSGSLETSFAAVQKPGAIHYSADYPYTADDSECTSASTGYALTIGSYATVTKYHNEIEGYTTDQVESNMLAHLAATGTLAACLDGSTFNTYVSGTMASCTGTNINLCVQVVGVTYDALTNIGYYKVRNSFGSDWGDNGFVYLSHGINACDITFNPGYTDPVDCC